MPMYRGKHVIYNMYFTEVERLFVVTEEKEFENWSGATGNKLLV